LFEQNAENFNVFYFKDFQFPKPTLSIKYKDLNNKTYTKRYKFNIEAVDTQAGNETIDTTKEFSYLAFRLE